jgi:hypothetical protein
MQTEKWVNFEEFTIQGKGSGKLDCQIGIPGDQQGGGGDIQRHRSYSFFSLRFK